MREEALHVFVLWSFAVAQPLYDLLGRNAEFFVAQGAGPAGLIAFVLLLSLAPPLLFAATQAAVGVISTDVRRWLHLLSVAVLSGIAMLPVLKRLDIEAAAFPLIASLPLGIAFAAAYVAWRPVRSFCTMLAPAIVVFPLFFLFLTPVASLLLPGSGEGNDEGKAAERIENSAPIVMIVFDEFNPTVLLDDRGRIDSVRFPHFAELAGNSWWFRNATSAHPETDHAIPTMLTSQYRSTAQNLPIHSDHSRNLFAWLGTRYRIRAFEPVTELCPRSICQRDVAVRGLSVDPRAFLTDVAVVYLHIVLPRSLVEGWLPPINSTWRGFKRFKEKKAKQSHDRGRTSEFESFIDGLLVGQGTFNFLHILLPHTPYQYLPSGDEYFLSSSLAAVGGKDAWPDDEALVEIGYLQYMLQVGYVDTMIGRLIDKLKAANRYDETLLVITADHGIAFEPGQERRKLNKDNAASILQVPLFIKLPHQTVGQASERRVSGIDVAATIADVLGAELPWQLDGHSAFGESFPDREVIVIRNYPAVGDVIRFSASAVTSFPLLAWQVDTFGAHMPLTDTVPRGPWPHLLGRSLKELPQAAPQPDLFVDSDTTGMFADVQFGEEPLPIFYRGRIVSSRGRGGQLSLALAVNDVIVSTTNRFSETDAGLSFILPVPVNALRNGRNSAEVFVVETRNGQPLLRAVPPLQQPDIRIVPDGADGEMLTSQAGEPIPIGRQEIVGEVKELKETGESIILQGWATDLVGRRPVSSILVFVNNNHVYSGRPTSRRLHVVREFRSDSFLNSGFRFEIPKSQVDLSRDELRLFGVSNGVAGELRLSY